jgi:ATP phosphoribosyltransferase
MIGTDTSISDLQLALPKGRMESGVLKLLSEAGISVTPTARSYRPAVSLPAVDAKMMKPQNIVEMLAHGSRDIGFAGADWVEELEAGAVELLDLGLDPVRVVAAAPEGLFSEPPARRLTVASEYQRLASRWIRSRGLEADLARSYGATEAFPPEDADVIVDNTATGSTLKANALEIVDEIMTSSTRFYASPQALDDAAKRSRIEDLCLLLESVLRARRRVMLEVNVQRERLDAVAALLPAMRKVTVASLLNGAGYAVKAAVPRSCLAEIIPAVKAAGGRDIVVTNLSQIAR